MKPTASAIITLKEHKIVAPLDPGFLPLVLARREYRRKVETSTSVADCALVIERHDNLRSRRAFFLFLHSK